ncbi:hypothetical protein [uncultured Sulfitobacter sp.]|uniref:hypothetical protein n=1 Tax=uncultured Sulfitobacter sp. TaxID=191468 RepID=UPI002615DB97|nr:hypothetical protein [uncultured Sulfitobacter sp.]
MSKPKLVKIVGSIGSYTADVDGCQLGVIHQTFYRPDGSYRHPFLKADFESFKVQNLISALKKYDLVVMQRDKDPETLARDGYVGVFRFKDFAADPDNGLSLKITARYADPKR